MSSSSLPFFCTFLQFVAKWGFVLDVFKIRESKNAKNPLCGAIQQFAMTLLSERRYWNFSVKISDIPPDSPIVTEDVCNFIMKNYLLYGNG